MGSEDLLTPKQQQKTTTIVGNEMRFESRRLNTFADWPSDAPVEARKIAKAGFFRTGDGSGTTGSSKTEVKCSWCNCVLSDWEYGDQVMAKHRSVNPDCPFIRNESDNVPLLNMNEANRIQRNTEEESSGQADNEANPPTPMEGDEVDHPDDPRRPPTTSDDDATDVAGTANGSFSSSADLSPTGTGNSSAFFRADLKSEAVRLKTFAKWPLTYIQPQRLAKSGFVFTGSRDCVRCVFCGEYVGEWTPDDDPVVEHRSLFPHCPFMQGQDVGNVPIDGEEDMDDTVASQSDDDHGTDHAGGGGVDDTGIRPRRLDLNSGPEKGPSVLHWSSDVAIGEPSSGVMRHSGPKTAKFSTVESRQRTFLDWPPALRQRPEDLAEAGFYYIGFSDQVKCFYCDGGLRNWQPEDDPWTEHSRWFSKCGFVRLVKGDEFIAKCLAERPPEEMPGLPVVSVSSSKDVVIRDEDIQQLMSSSIVQQALAMGIEASRVKMAIKERLRTAGSMFKSTNQLVDAAFGVHREQEDRHSVEVNESPSAFERSSSCPASRVDLTQQEGMDLAGDGSGMACGGGSERTESRNSTKSEASGMSHSKSAPTDASSEFKSLEETKSHSFTEGTDLEQENRRLKEQRTCKICMDNEIGVVFLPCGHLICCKNCAPALKECPMCRQPIHGTVKTYMS